MKTAEEILNKVIDESGFDYDSALKAMKAYASQALDEAAKKAKLKVTSIRANDAEGMGGSFYEVDKDSILNLKSQLH